VNLENNKKLHVTVPSMRFSVCGDHCCDFCNRRLGTQWSDTMIDAAELPCYALDLSTHQILRLTRWDGSKLIGEYYKDPGTPATASFSDICLCMIENEATQTTEFMAARVKSFVNGGTPIVKDRGESASSSQSGVVVQASAASESHEARESQSSTMEIMNVDHARMGSQRGKRGKRDRRGKYTIAPAASFASTESTTTTAPPPVGMLSNATLRLNHGESPLTDQELEASLDRLILHSWDDQPDSVPHKERMNEATNDPELYEDTWTPSMPSWTWNHIRLLEFIHHFPDLAPRMRGIVSYHNYPRRVKIAVEQELTGFVFYPTLHLDDALKIPKYAEKIRSIPEDMWKSKLEPDVYPIVPIPE